MLNEGLGWQKCFTASPSPRQAGGSQGWLLLCTARGKGHPAPAPGYQHQQDTSGLELEEQHLHRALLPVQIHLPGGTHASPTLTEQDGCREGWQRGTKSFPKPPWLVKDGLRGARWLRSQPAAV